MHRADNCKDEKPPTPFGLTDERIQKLEEIGFTWQQQVEIDVNGDAQAQGQGQAQQEGQGQGQGGAQVQDRTEYFAQVFEDYFHELIAYRESFGDCNVFPTGESDYQDLKEWCEQMREDYKKIKRGEVSNYSLPQIKKLLYIGFKIDDADELQSDDDDESDDGNDDDDGGGIESDEEVDDDENDNDNAMVVSSTVTVQGEQ